jgi:natural product biosynthesis luciferase-like monooxygenase protein
MLFHHLRDTASGVDIEQMVVSWDHDVHATDLRDAWRAVMHHHEAFRTTFEWGAAGTTEQVVHAEVPFDWTEEDWRTIPTGEQEPRLEAFLREDRQRGFDLRTPPLTRFTLFRRSDRAAWFVWTFHHIVADGMSYPLLVRSAFEFYDARRRGEMPKPFSNTPRYRTFIDWRQKHRPEGEEAYWRGLLAGFTAPTPLPAPSSGDGPSVWQERSRQLSTSSTRALREFTHSIGVTLATAVEAAWALVLANHSGEDDVLFGVTRAGRRSTIPGAEDIVGNFINTLPVRATIDRQANVTKWLQERRAAATHLRTFEHSSLLDIHKWSDVPTGQPLFESNLVYTPRLVGASLGELGGPWSARKIKFLEQTSFPLSLFTYGEEELLLKFVFDAARISPEAIDRCLAQLQSILEALPGRGTGTIRDLPMLASEEEHQLVRSWNRTARAFDQLCIHALFEQQVERTPDATALTIRDQSCSYRELNRRANRLARELVARGAGPDQMVGIFVDRSIDMVVGLLGVLKSGAAFVPLDPSYPRERLGWMLDDAAATLVVTQPTLVSSLPPDRASVLTIDSRAAGAEFDDNPKTNVGPADLAYVIFTSGSSGRPKGVMVEHRNVANFFAGMDDALSFKTPGVWLAVTSISFDISVLELFWTLTRGFTVVIQEELDRTARRAPRARTSTSSRPIDFSLFYFAADAGDDGGSRYRLLLEGAKYADTHAFSAVWTPERHFHAFGGLYPNPAVTSAAIAAITTRVAIRAGSVVLPLHDPIRVAEEWSVVDNLSGGRVGFSFASGWHVNDFVLKPDNYRDRKNVMLAAIETVRRLWKGEAVAARNGNGDPIEIRIFPSPVQADPAIWITSAGNIDSFRVAGELGANLLTNLLGQKLEEVALKIAAYRDARRQAGHAGNGIVSLMLHTFVGDDLDAVRETVRRPFIDYLRTSTELVKQARWEFPAFATPGKRQGPVDNSDLSPAEIGAMLDHAFERYFQTSGLFGTPDICAQMVDRLKEAGVDEIACLIDFGVTADQVLASLDHLNEVRLQSNESPSGTDDYSLATQIARHKVTHLQCTPSLLRTLLLDHDGAAALADLDLLMLGGEALPPALAAEVAPRLRGRLLNMYGPTETTVWSATATVTPQGPITLGRPIANTQIFLVDRQLQLVPIGAPGELLIGGAGVARGYLQHPELTEEKFVTLWFTGDEPRRLYRTGDLARYRDDGRLEFLGRIDHQVKVRGHRIELGEIETALGAHEDVRQAVAMAREGGDGQQQLVAYVVPEVAAPSADGESGHGQLVQRLKQHLRATLPSHMMPGAFVLLEAFPHTPNGKINRKALPAPDRQRSETAAAYTAPASDLEQVIAQTWSELLGLDRVSTTDNFFDLGANSLLMVQAHAALKDRLQRSISLVDLFQYPTVASLAGSLTSSRESSALADSHARAQIRADAMSRRQSRRAARVMSKP